MYLACLVKTPLTNILLLQKKISATHTELLKERRIVDKDQVGFEIRVI